MLGAGRALARQGRQSTLLLARPSLAVTSMSGPASIYTHGQWQVAKPIKTGTKIKITGNVSEALQRAKALGTDEEDGVVSLPVTVNRKFDVDWSNLKNGKGGGGGAGGEEESEKAKRRRWGFRNWVHLLFGFSAMSFYLYSPFSYPLDQTRALKFDPTLDWEDETVQAEIAAFIRDVAVPRAFQQTEQLIDSAGLLEAEERKQDKKKGKTVEKKADARGVGDGKDDSMSREQKLMAYAEQHGKLVGSLKWELQDAAVATYGTRVVPPTWLRPVPLVYRTSRHLLTASTKVEVRVKGCKPTPVEVVAHFVNDTGYYRLEGMSARDATQGAGRDAWAAVRRFEQDQDGWNIGGLLGRKELISGTLSVSSVVNGKLMISNQPQYTITEDRRQEKASAVLSRVLSEDGTKSMVVLGVDPDNKSVLSLQKTVAFHTKTPPHKRETHLRDVLATLGCRTVEEAQASLRSTFNARGLAQFQMRLFEEVARSTDGPWDADMTSMLFEAVALYDECGRPEESAAALIRIAEGLKDPKKPAADPSALQMVSFLQDLVADTRGQLEDPDSLLNSPVLDLFDPITILDTFIVAAEGHRANGNKLQWANRTIEAYRYLLQSGVNDRLLRATIMAASYQAAAEMGDPHADDLLQSALAAQDGCSVETFVALALPWINAYSERFHGDDLMNQCLQSAELHARSEESGDWVHLLCLLSKANMCLQQGDEVVAERFLSLAKKKCLEPQLTKMPSVCAFAFEPCKDSAMCIELDDEMPNGLAGSVVTQYQINGPVVPGTVLEVEFEVDEGDEPDTTIVPLTDEKMVTVHGRKRKIQHKNKVYSIKATMRNPSNPEQVHKVVHICQKYSCLSYDLDDVDKHCECFLRYVEGME